MCRHPFLDADLPYFRLCLLAVLGLELGAWHLVLGTYCQAIRGQAVLAIQLNFGAIASCLAFVSRQPNSLSHFWGR